MKLAGEQVVFARRVRLSFAAALVVVMGALVASQPGVVRQAHAQPIPNQIAVFAGLDKITATITRIEIPINHTATFGALKVTPRACHTRPPTEPPKTTAFVEVDETRHQGGPRRIFTGWMFAASPGLHGVEHPVYDIWLTDCKTSAPLKPGDKR